VTEPPAVELDHASKSYRLYRRRETSLKETIIRRRRGVWEDFLALDDVSLAIPKGEAVGIIGRNGSGKSTLLKLLAKIIEPDQGTVTTNGRVSALLEVGAGFHPDYTAIENIYLSGAIYGVPRAVLERRIDSIIAFAELERFADNPVKTYSSGMYARLGFSIAVNVDPEILLIDEVLAVGDQSFQARCLDRMLEFRDAGKTLVLVTHDLGAVEAFCDRAVWIDGGVVRDDALPHHVVRNYVRVVNESDEAKSAIQVEARGAAVAGHTARPGSPLSLVEMRFVGSDGANREVFHNGEPVTIEVRCRARSAVTDPVCEIAIKRHDGVDVTTSSTRIADVHSGRLDGLVAFTWAIEDLALTPGTYYVTPRLLDETGINVLDEHQQWYRIRVHAGAYRERHGVAVLRGEWSVRELERTLAEPAPVREGSGRG
jgi:ABC-type polysaccharide/polyol phosphate transport system ATPase subunit